LRKRKPCGLDLSRQSMLRYSNTDLAHLNQIATVVFDTKTLAAKEGLTLSGKPRPEYSEHVDLIGDICEKLGFVWIAKREIDSTQSAFEIVNNERWQHVRCGEVKYHVHNIVYDCKATVDSCSMLFNLIFRLPYKRKEIDLIRNKRFRDDVIERSKHFESYWNRHGGWFGNFADTRDELIHRRSMPIFVCNVRNRDVFDILPVSAENGSIRKIEFAVMPATVGEYKVEFRWKGLQVVSRAPLIYVLPRPQFTFHEISSGKKPRFKDFQEVGEYCEEIFIRLKGLAEITFEETLKSIADTSK